LSTTEFPLSRQPQLDEIAAGIPAQLGTRFAAEADDGSSGVAPGTRAAPQSLLNVEWTTP
jgi:hypothetical protein